MRTLRGEDWAAALRQRSGETPRPAILASAGGGASAHLWRRTTILCGRCVACSTWAWARGGPASLGRRCTHARARRRGGGRLASSSSLLMVFDSPAIREMSAPPWRRSALCFGDAASVEECVETWDGGLGTWGRRGGLISSKGHCLSVRPLCFVSFCLMRFERDSRVSPTPRQLLFGSRNKLPREAWWPYRPPFAATLRKLIL